MQREVNGWMFLACHEILGHILRHCPRLRTRGVLFPVRWGDCRSFRAARRSPRTPHRCRCRCAPQRIYTMPESAHEFLAHDDRHRSARLVFLTEAAAGEYRKARRFEIVAPHHMPARPFKIFSFVACAGKQHAGIAVHSDGQRISEIRGDHGRQSLHSAASAWPCHRTATSSRYESSRPFTADLQEWANWLTACGITTMESTGV